MLDIGERLGDSLKNLVGFVFPKFSSDNAEDYLSGLRLLNEQANTVLYGMPILESPNVLYKERRLARVA